MPGLRLPVLTTTRREFSQAVRASALIRCKYRCETCGRKSDLELHHRGHRGDNSLFNCQVLCAGCHDENMTGSIGARRIEP